MFGVTLTQTAWFLPAVLPICLFVAWSDLKRMKIPNVAVYALVCVFAVAGLAALPFAEYAWRWTHLVVVLVIGIALNAGRLLGAGDAKFAAAAAPFVALADVGRMMMLLGACLLAGYVTHRIAKYSPLRRLVPDWASWAAGKRFPMGYPLAAALAIYLAWPLLA